MGDFFVYHSFKVSVPASKHSPLVKESLKLELTILAGTRNEEHWGDRGGFQGNLFKGK